MGKSSLPLDSVPPVGRRFAFCVIVMLALRGVWAQDPAGSGWTASAAGAGVQAQYAVPASFGQSVADGAGGGGVQWIKPTGNDPLVSGGQLLAQW
jgi:hypothetical protein